MSRLAQRLQDQRQLHGGDVPYLVDDDEVVACRGQRLPLPSNPMAVEKVRLDQPLTKLPEQKS